MEAAPDPEAENSGPEYRGSQHDNPKGRDRATLGIDGIGQPRGHTSGQESHHAEQHCARREHGQPQRSRLPERKNQDHDGANDNCSLGQSRAAWPLVSLVLAPPAYLPAKNEGSGKSRIV